MCEHVAIQWQITWWRHQMETFSALLALCAGNSPVRVNSPHKGKWRGALMFSLNCAWINGWVNNPEAGDLIRYRAHYDVIVMIPFVGAWFWIHEPWTSKPPTAIAKRQTVYSRSVRNNRLTPTERHRTPTTTSGRAGQGRAIHHWLLILAYT